MNNFPLRLSKAPIVEAILDIDCDMLPAFDLAALESPVRQAYQDFYPKFRAQPFQNGRIELHEGEPPKFSQRQFGVQAFYFLQEDERQLVQMRAQGFSFNRLAPYTSLDDYLPEIKRTWKLFANIASPLQIRQVRLRYINRILVPLKSGEVDLEEYFKVSPQLPDENNLKFLGFFNQHAVVEQDTGNRANIILTTQAHEDVVLPLIFDIEAIHSGSFEPEWNLMLAKIESLRSLKNRIFKNTLTEQCLKLF